MIGSAYTLSKLGGAHERLEGIGQLIQSVRPTKAAAEHEGGPEILEHLGRPQTDQRAQKIGFIIQQAFGIGRMLCRHHPGQVRARVC